MLSTLAKQAAPLTRLGCILALLTLAAAGRAEQSPQTLAKPERSTVKSLIHPRNVPTPLPMQRAVHITTVVVNNKITTFSYGSPVTFTTRDPLGVYSGRPLLAVGDVVNVDPTSRTVTLAIKRELSSMPHKLELDAKKKKVYEKLLDREFPATRTFFVSRYTEILDGGLIKSRSQLLENNRERMARISIKLEDLHAGNRVSVTYRMNENPDVPPAVFNISKQDPNRRDYEADYRTMPRIQNKAAQTSLTQARDLPSSHGQAKDIRTARKAWREKQAPEQTRKPFKVR